MGIHRNVIHPKFGNFVLLGTVLMDAEVTAYSQPLDYNPCLNASCASLLVRRVPSAPMGTSTFCMLYAQLPGVHGGFNDWVERLPRAAAPANTGKKCPARKRFPYGRACRSVRTKGAYCMAVCPAGEDVIAPFLTDRKRFLEDVVSRCRTSRRRFTWFQIPTPKNTWRGAIRIRKQNEWPTDWPGKARFATSCGAAICISTGPIRGLNATYHFTFTGQED